MKKLFIAFCLFLSIGIFAQSVEKEQEAIKDIIQTAYVEGLQNEGNIRKIDAGIHPEFNLLGIDKGDEMWKLSISEWKDKTVKRLDAGELPRKENLISIKFLDIDVTGTAAVVKIEFYVGEKLTYVDYISLYKFESGWKMVNKIYYKFK
ncbi:MULTISPECIES: nuclear transport factor 2 family protein [unclassified Lentimicrobium]|uniref:nuclear transport factor 2 family protein n=1 Tax=unclassified Lentimicrobium TaxID=2677434 RepID=UPI001553E342|nr:MULTISPECIES: nuclear transport factor 2 family protein [unclassified Lentimicrobium]NPD46806.1 hypothetical protein [Lentimicrobium sp. S6]NPD85609.1 hypothetical protein [Lentimicrobium sp. L6]